jgi:ribosomal protein S18 acetylase RimI-like enzyme
MQFELTKELIEEIIFFMEDQDGIFMLDTHEGIVINTDDDEFREYDDNEEEQDDERLISIPEWEPSDGFNLMGRFTAGLRNPEVREKLSAALDRGRGVFRAFKDAIGPHPEIEKLWFNFKEREMKREVVRWYNALRESWGLELIGEEPEDTSSLVLEDFRFRESCASDRQAAEELHECCTHGCCTHRCCADKIGGAETAVSASDSMGYAPWAFPGDICIVAETSGNDFAAYISAAYVSTGHLHVCALEVKPEYRGLGLGKALLARLTELADSGKASRITIDLPAAYQDFSRALVRDNFQLSVTHYSRTTQSP